MVNKVFLLGLTLLCLGWSTMVAAAELVRVALVSGQYSAELIGQDDFVVVENSTGRTTTLTKGKYFLRGEDGSLIIGDQRFQGSLGIQALPDKRLPQVNKRAYAGSYQLSLFQEQLLLVNLVELEDYLASVLPSKTMPVWPEATVKAQIVAARSYVKYQLATHGSAAYDLSANDEELRYTGLAAVRPRLHQLLAATAGAYLVDEQGFPVEALTTSSSGGRTESALELWGREVPYLQSLEDYDQDSPDYQWEERFLPAQVQNLLEQQGHRLGKLTSIRLSTLAEPSLDRTPSGRVRQLILTGTEGSVRCSGTQLQQLLGLPSNLFEVETGVPRPASLRVPIENYYGMEIGSKDIDINLEEGSTPVWKQVAQSVHLLSGAKEEKLTFKGRGRGHGLGLSAWGARGLANAQPDLSYQEILQYYYPRTVLRK